MAALFEQGFFVRVPAWHGLGVVLDDYPGREQAMELAGHNWDVVETKVRVEYPNEILAAMGQEIVSSAGVLKHADGWKAHLRSDNGTLLHVSQDSYERIPNSVPYDFAELLCEQGFQYETGVTLDGGRLNALPLLLNEPVVITGDDSEAIPYLGLAWSHDGSCALRGNYTTVRRVCANTVAMSESEGRRNGSFFSIKHTKNWAIKVDEAKAALKGLREAKDVYVEAMEDLATIQVTPEQRDLFVSTIIGDKDEVLATSAATSTRVKNNLERERTKILRLFMGDTIPEAHKLTGYGLHLAGVEYFDHLRNYRSQDSYVKRQLLQHNPAKANLAKTIKEVAVA